MSKKKQKKGGKKKLTKRLTKQLRRVIKVHGAELALGFVTGIITELIAAKTNKPEKTKKKKNTGEQATEEQPALVTAVQETTQAVANKVKAAVAPKTPVAKKAPVRKTAAKPTAPAPTTEPA